MLPFTHAAAAFAVTLASLAPLQAQAPPAAAAPSILASEKYQLGNGLTVILHPDASLPLAGINLWYRVGARNEPRGRSGFAHLYEHLMFMGTARVPGGDFDRLMEAGGGSNNASTSLDRTNYFSAGPSALLPTLLWLDADRLEAMGAAMTQDKLDKQRDVVRNEIRQNVENTPYGRAYELSYRLLYPEGHPYHNAVYGTHADLEAASVLDVKDFFATFYNPANCSIVVAGDFDPALVRPLVAGLFGTLPGGAAPRPPEAPPVVLGRVVRATLLDQVQLPKVMLCYHSPPAYKPGDAEMNLLALLLADGPSSRLHKRLVLQDETAVSVAAYQESAVLGSIFRLEVLARPGADLREMEKAIDEEIRDLAADGPTEAEVRQRQKIVELALLSPLQDVQARADRLNEYEFFFGEPDSLQRDLDRYRAATPASLARAARDTLTPASRVVIRVLPEGVPDGPSPRQERPPDAPARIVQSPLPESFTLSGGMPVHYWRRPGLPLVHATLVLGAQAPLDPPAQAGRTALLARMLTEGAGELDGPAFASALQSLGMEVSAAAGRTTLSLSLSGLASGLEQAAGLWASALLSPRLTDEDFSRVRGLHIEELLQADQDPPALAARVAARTLFDESSPHAWPVEGMPATIESLRAPALRSHLADLTRAPAAILVAGDVEPARLRAVLERAFGSLSTQPGPAASPVPAPPPAAPFRAAGGLRVYLVDRPGAVQTVIRFAAPGAAASDPARLDHALLNTVLGGSFTSRLNLNLRETNGYTYGAGSRLSPQRDLGLFTASTSVQSAVTGPALKEFLGELRRIADGPSPDEVGKAVRTHAVETAQAFATLDALVAEAARLHAAGQPWTTPAADLRAAADADAPRLAKVAPTLAPLDRGVLVLVGDQPLILEQIKDLGLPAPIILAESSPPPPAP